MEAFAITIRRRFTAWGKGVGVVENLNKLKLLVIGRTGQLATELRRRADVTCLGRAEADLTDPDACARAIKTRAPEVVINAAAYTAVDAAEADEENARAINSEAPGAMASACAAIGARFIHISTDYVFDGSGDTPWQPSDQTGPLGAYGRTKLEGERAISAAGGDWTVIRTSWVFSAHGSNFVKTMLRLGSSRDVLQIVADQIGGPTEAGDLAEAALAVARQPKGTITPAVHHFAGAPDVSWADFAREIFRQAKLQTKVENISSRNFPTPAPRPKNSRLDCTSMAAFGVTRPDWRQSLTRVLTEIGVVN